jgi:hypothetical protein
MRGDLSCGELLVGDEAQDLAPVRLGDGSEGGVHRESVSRSLRKKQATFGPGVSPGWSCFVPQAFGAGAL